MFAAVSSTATLLWVYKCYRPNRVSACAIFGPIPRNRLPVDAASHPTDQLVKRSLVLSSGPRLSSRAPATGIPGGKRVSFSQNQFLRPPRCSTCQLFRFQATAALEPLTSASAPPSRFPFPALSPVFGPPPCVAAPSSYCKVPTTTKARGPPCFWSLGRCMVYYPSY